MPNYTIKLKNIYKGIYIFHNEGSTGKSCLKRMIDKCNSFGAPVSAFSYEDSVKGLKPIDICKLSDKIVMFDRYGMYANKYNDEVCLFAKHTTVLIDAKSPAYVPADYQVCVLNMVSPFCFEIRGGGPA